MTFKSLFLGRWLLWPKEVRAIIESLEEKSRKLETHIQKLEQMLEEREKQDNGNQGT